MDLPALDLGVGVAADDEVHPRQVRGDLDVVVIAKVGEEDHHVALVAQPLVLLHRLQDGGESDVHAVVGVGVRMPGRAELHGADDPDLDAVHEEHLVGKQVHPPFGIRVDVGAYIVEIGQGDQPGQSGLAGVELVVAQSGEVETDLVHQGDHRIGRDFIEIVERLSGAVVSGGDHEQSGVDGTHAVHDGGQLREGLDVGVHIVGGDDMHLFGLGAGQGADQARGGQQERQFPSHLAGFI